jgi:two-component system, LytTR family, sensor kinase
LPGLPHQRWWMAFFGELSQLAVKIPLSYFIIYLVTGNVEKKPIVKILMAIGAFAIAIVLQRILIIQFVLPHIYHEEVKNSFMFNWRRMLSTFLDLIFVVGIVLAVKQYRITQRSKETNPHFLFNTLNNIYALARKKSDATADVVMKLSKLLRFMLYESRKSHITIADELRVLSDYIELEKIRYNERLTLRFNKSIDDETQAIAPLILLPFVENAFKHGVGETRFNSFIHIDVILQKGQLIFMIENSKEDEREEYITENIGLSNVRRQLQLMYPEHNLDMEISKNVFKVTLTINLHSYAAV